MRLFFAGLLLFVAGLACGWGGAWLKVRPALAESRRLDAILRLREEEGDRLRDILKSEERARGLEKSKGQRAAIEKQVTEICGLPFKHPVDYAILTREQIKGVVAGKLADTFSEQEFANMSAALSRLGLLPPGYPLRQKYIDLLGEQIAAFYDQHQHKLFMFEDATLDNAQNCVILAHELTHALQDQYYDLLRLPLEIKDNDDRAAAASALVEGEATLVMSEYMMKNMSLRALKDNLASTFGTNMDQMKTAPRYLRESLVFPYLRGQEFCATLVEQGGYEAISKAFGRLPESTSQIIHPEKYLAARPEAPVRIAWADTSFAGQKATDDNVLGELGIRILLEESGHAQAAEHAAAGWKGDRYLSFGNGDALVWKTIWDSEKDAAEFFEAERQGLEKRYHLEQPRTSADQFAADAPRTVRLVRLPGNAVLLIDAASADGARELQDRFGK